MATFESKNGKLFIDGKQVLKAWESFSGWFWFGTEKQDNWFNETDEKAKDIVWFGFVQGFEEEWGFFSQSEIESLAPRTWEIKAIDLPSAGRRNY